MQGPPTSLTPQPEDLNCYYYCVSPTHVHEVSTPQMPLASRGRHPPLPRESCSWHVARCPWRFTHGAGAHSLAPSAWLPPASSLRVGC